MWWTNRFLHLFGWAIVCQVNDENEVIACFPARVGFRGFSPEVEEKGFVGLTQYLADNHKELLNEVLPEPEDDPKPDER